MAPSSGRVPLVLAALVAVALANSAPADHRFDKDSILHSLLRAKRDAQFDVKYDEFGIPTYTFQVCAQGRSL